MVGYGTGCISEKYMNVQDTLEFKYDDIWISNIDLTCIVIDFGTGWQMIDD